MIQATPKADSLPPDLRKYWEDQMGDKFPMTQAEAMAYISNRFNCSAWAEGQDKIRVTYTERHPISEGEAIEAGWTIEYQDGGQVAYQQVGLGASSEQLLRMMNQQRIPRYRVRFTEIILDDFRPTNINSKLKEIKS